MFFHFGSDGQVSCPSSPGPGTVQDSQSCSPVLASRATAFPRNAQSPFARPVKTTPRAYIGVPETACPVLGGSYPICFVQTTSPVFCLTAATRPSIRPANTSPSPSDTPGGF